MSSQSWGNDNENGSGRENGPEDANNRPDQDPAEDPGASDVNPFNYHIDDPDGQDDAPDYGSAENELKARIETLESELDKAKDQMVRAVAEAENIRKRSLKDRDDARKYAITDFARDLLDFSDNFRRAIDSLPDDLKEQDERVRNVVTGIEAMDKELRKTLEKHGIKKMDPLEEIFDPNYHEVMFEVPASNKPAGTIVQVVEPGYIINDRLLRPARVGVAKDEGQGNSAPPGSPGQHLDEEA